MIKTKENWYATAAEVIPMLPGYLREFNVELPETTETMMQMLAEQKHKELYRLFDMAWILLPDNPSIRHHPFFKLCDLCSKYWVFDEEESANVDREDQR